MVVPLAAVRVVTVPTFAAVIVPPVIVKGLPLRDAVRRPVPSGQVQESVVAKARLAEPQTPMATLAAPRAPTSSTHAKTNARFDIRLFFILED